MYDLYNSTINEYTVNEDDGDPIANAQAVRDWFIKRHQSIHILLAEHVEMEVWDRIARNRKKGYDKLLEIAPGSFTRADIKHGRSRALPNSMANVAYAKWTGNLLWEKGLYKDSGSCLFGENYKKCLHNMVNRGVTMIGFHDEERKKGVGRLFVGISGGPGVSEEEVETLVLGKRGRVTSPTPNGLYCFEGVGQLGDMGYMPHQSGGDIIQQLTNLPHKVVLGNDTTWIGSTKPTEEERDALIRIPFSYNMFQPIEGVATGVPPPFKCSRCEVDLPEMTSRIYEKGKDKEGEESVKWLDEERKRLTKIYLELEASPEYTPGGRLTAEYNRRQKQAAEEYSELSARLNSAKHNPVPVCMECKIHDILPTR